jgi:hypothetical protein
MGKSSLDDCANTIAAEPICNRIEMVLTRGNGASHKLLKYAWILRMEYTITTTQTTTSTSTLEKTPQHHTIRHARIHGHVLRCQPHALTSIGNSDGAMEIRYNSVRYSLKQLKKGQNDSKQMLLGA